jgi:hypothetical protein
VSFWHVQLAYSVIPWQHLHSYAEKQFIDEALKLISDRGDNVTGKEALWRLCQEDPNIAIPTKRQLKDSLKYLVKQKLITIVHLGNRGVQEEYAVNPGNTCCIRHLFIRVFHQSIS